MSAKRRARGKLTGIGVIVVVLLDIRASLSVLEVLVLDLGESNHLGRLKVEKDRRRAR